MQGNYIGFGLWRSSAAIELVQSNHNDDTTAVMNGAPVEAARPMEAPKAELGFYRKYTEGLLRRYLRLSMQAGRVPSLLGRELFRGNVTHYKSAGLEDVVIFCHDVEQRLAKLNSMDKELVKLMALQQYTREEAARMLGIGLSSCKDRYVVAIDRLTRLFLDARLLEPKVEQQGGRKDEPQIVVKGVEV